MHKMTIYPFLFLLLFFQSSLVCGIEKQGCGSWTSKSPMPTPRTEVAAALLDGKIYVIGGFDSQGETNLVEAYDISKDFWGKIAPLPMPLHHTGAASVGGKVYVIGGGPRPGLSFSNVNEVFTPK